MTYTEENIIGVEFAEKTKEGNLYKCLRIEDNSVVMTYLTDIKGYTFSNSVSWTLKMMNDGLWKDFGSKEVKQENFYIF